MRSNFRKKFLFGASCMAIACTSPAQETWVQLYTIPIKAERVELDNLHNVYTIAGAELKKFDQYGNPQFRYSDKQLGNIGGVDVTFPLRLLVKYTELNYVALLDNTLSNNRGNINMLSHGIGLYTAACSSVQNHFWFYDSMTFSLSRCNENFRKVAETGNLAQILNTELQPDFMMEYANRLYVNNPATGILVFDIFGTYIKTLPIKNCRKFLVTETAIFWSSDSTLRKYNFTSGRTTEIALPVKAIDIAMQEKRIALLTANEVQVYRADTL